jgi:hypothetical protein
MPLYAMSEDAPKQMGWKKAARFARKKCTAHGQRNWRLPEAGELEMIFNIRAALGLFNTSGDFSAGWYWSAAEGDKNDAKACRFTDGPQVMMSKDIKASVRYVRS